MATYIPGTQTFMPTFQPFTPDYKFLSDVINTKTNRYETNYKAINDTYDATIPKVHFGNYATITVTNN